MDANPRRMTFALRVSVCSTLVVLRFVRFVIDLELDLQPTSISNGKHLAKVKVQ